MRRNLMVANFQGNKMRMNVIRYRSLYMSLSKSYT